MKNIKLHGCFACFCGHDCKKQKLPRKKKKELKKLYSAFPSSVNHGSFDGITSCHLASDYKHWRLAIRMLMFLLKYKKEIQFIIQKTANYDFGDSPVYLDENGRLSWYWEYDNDYGGSSGIMPFCYTKEEAGDTWAFDEVKDLLQRLWVYQDYDNREFKDYVFPENIKSDRDFLKHITQYLTY